MNFKRGSFNKHTWTARGTMACLQRQAVFSVPLDDKKMSFKTSLFSRHQHLKDTGYRQKKAYWFLQRIFLHSSQNNFPWQSFSCKWIAFYFSWPV